MTSRSYNLKAELRTDAGKGVARALRREKKVPAVIYGDGKEPVIITLPNKEITLEFHKGHLFTSLCDLDVDGKTHKVLARDVQLHPVTDIIEHVDFIRVTPKTKIRVHVPVKLLNEDKCPGLVKSKGTLNIIQHEIDLLCIATDIPDHIDIDLSELTVGHSIHINDVTLPKGVTPAVKDRNFAIVGVMAPRRVVEETPAADAAAAAPAAGAAPAAAPAKDEKKK